MSEPRQLGSPLRIVLALLAGALTGGTLVPVGMLLGAALATGSLVPLPGDVMTEIVGIGGAYATIYFACGLALIGAPAWFVLHRLGRRGWMDAALLGVVLSFAAAMVLSVFWILTMPEGSTYSAGDSGGQTVVENVITPYGWLSFVAQSALIAFAGGIAGVTIWAIAYPRVPRNA